MLNASELRKGVTIELEGELYQVLDYKHIKMGRGSAQVRVKLRDINAGHNIDRVFQSGEKFPIAELESQTMQYLYNDADLYYFMDTETFEQIPINASRLGEILNYLKEDMSVQVSSYKGKLIGVELPMTVELKVVDTGPDFKGDTASAGTKPATLETGLTVQVPFFVNNGDIIKVDTRTGNYLERAG